MATSAHASDDKSPFIFFWKKESVFSQFYMSPFKVGDQSYVCAEQYMMHQKAVQFNDEETAQEILESDCPPEMKSLGRRVKNYDDDVWEQECVKVVKKGNIHKFSQNPDLKAALFETKGKTLVEASPFDRKWGIGLGAKNKLAQNKATWRGRNLLGYILTEVRDELMEEEGLS